ncbi:ATP-binding protein [Rhizocola hellebori]|uniref:ATP-binding protein n=1 Tax=Rhizocola hellebori TaxID=1392758 RepID=UPI001941F893|nr:tetratricopeptide repeat protein [Rhizocola hellebori]
MAVFTAIAMGSAVLIAALPRRARSDVEYELSSGIYEPQRQCGRLVDADGQEAPEHPRNGLPRDTATFTGRAEDLARILAAAREATDGQRTVAVHAIDGMAGVGKTTLVVHAGHRLAKLFPDGQLFIDLYAHTAGHTPVAPSDALASLLLANGLAPQLLPATLEERAALWRGRLAGRKVLLVLDNAASYEQVLPLLPGAGQCLVLVTSRRRLAALDAVVLALDTLPAEQASSLFVRLSGRDVSEMDPIEVDQVVRLCGCLPLAVSLVAGRLRHHPTWKGADVIADLTATESRLETIRAESKAAAAAFDLSHRYLPAERQLLFRRLGLHPGADVDAYAAAALADLPLLRVQEHLELLYDEHLLEEPSRGRYRMHDLVRDYSRTLAATEEAHQRDLARERLYDYYQSTAALADQQIARDPRVASAAPANWAGTAPDVSTIHRALVWMRSEQANLFDCIRAAQKDARHRRVVGLASAAAGYLFHDGLYRPAAELHRAAISAAQAVGDQSGEAGAYYDLAPMLYCTGDTEGAAAALRRAVDMYREIGQPLGEANSLKELAFVTHVAGDSATAKPMQEEAVALYQELGQPLGEANALNYLGYTLLADDYAGAIDALTRSLGIYRQLNDRHGTADALQHLGDAWSCTGQLARAVEANEQALPIFRELGDRLRERNALLSLAYALRLLGDFQRANSVAEEALAICRDLGEWSGEVHCLTTLAALRLSTGNPQDAITMLAGPLRFYHDQQNETAYATTLDYLAQAHNALGDHAKADELWQLALQIYRRLNERLGHAEVLNNLGALNLELGDLQQAQRYHQNALQIAREIHAPIEEAHALRGLGRCALRHNEIDTSLDQLRQAQRIFEQTGAYQSKEVAIEIIDISRTNSKRRSPIGKWIRRI